MEWYRNVNGWVGSVNSWRQNTKNLSVDKAVKGSAFHLLHLERMISTEKQSMEIIGVCFALWQPMCEQVVQNLRKCT